jgi:hypothetical protein
MKTLVTLSTPAARKAEKFDGPSEVESYTDESGTVTFFCTPEEREEFERDQVNAGHAVEIDGDMLAPDTFSIFAAWLMSNARLSLQHVGYNA